MMHFTCLIPQTIIGLQNSISCEIIPLKHGMIEAKNAAGELQVERLFSTDLKDYLNPSYMSGATLEKR